MLKRYDQVTLLCPVAATGGPEALHQLAQFINAIGIPARLAYYGNGARIAIRDKAIICEPPQENTCLKVYSKYNPIAANRVELTENSLVILPEVRISDVDLFVPADVAIWWLSVANAFHQNSPIIDEQTRIEFFKKKNIHHFCQTFYSRELLQQHNVSRVYDLVDYTDDLFTAIMPKSHNQGNAITYNPKKGSSLAESFFKRIPSIESIKIENMNKSQIYSIFSKTIVYIEFGHNPGKDRMPREAAAAGCIVLAHRQGGTMFYDDMPIDDCFKFDAADVHSGRLRDLVLKIMDDPRTYWERQRYYRSYLYTERELMTLQIKRIFEL